MDRRKRKIELLVYIYILKLKNNGKFNNGEIQKKSLLGIFRRSDGLLKVLLNMYSSDKWMLINSDGFIDASKFANSYRIS